MSGDDLQVVNNEEKGRFEVRLGEEVAYAEYRLLATGVLFPHTEVPPASEGRGIAAALVQAALAYARAQGLRVRPSCSYVRSYMRRHPDTLDLLEH